MKSCKEFEINKELSDFNGCKYLVYYVDREVTGGVLPENIAEIEKITEIRAFNNTREIWLHRECLGVDFCVREKDDSDIGEDDYFDETQLLDIDTTVVAVEKDGKTTFTATGGGKYTLPAKADDNAVKIRNYLRFNEKTGRAEFDDFRILDFVKADIREVQ